MEIMTIYKGGEEERRGRKGKEGKEGRILPGEEGSKNFLGNVFQVGGLKSPCFSVKVKGDPKTVAKSKTFEGFKKETERITKTVEL
jgi:hypothetical protein